MLEQCININRMCPNYKLEFNNTNSQLLHVYTGALYAGQTRNYIVGSFSGRHLSVLRGHSFFSSPPQRPMTSDFEGFLYNYITLFSYLNSWERASIYPFQCWVLNKGTTWYHFYNIFGMTRSLTGDWFRDLPHSEPALYH